MFKTTFNYLGQISFEIIMALLFKFDVFITVQKRFHCHDLLKKYSNRKYQENFNLPIQIHLD